MYIQNHKVVENKNTLHSICVCKYIYMSYNKKKKIYKKNIKVMCTYIYIYIIQHCSYALYIE